MMVFDEYLPLLDRAIREELFHYSPDERRRFGELIASLKITTRPYFLEAKMIQTFIWDPVRKDEAVFNLVMCCTVNFTTCVQLHNPNAIYELAGVLAQALSGVTHRDSVLVDADIRQKITAMDIAKKTLANENWLVFVLFAMLNYRVIHQAVVDLNANTQENPHKS